MRSALGALHDGVVHLVLHNRNRSNHETDAYLGHGYHPGCAKRGDCAVQKWISINILEFGGVLTGG